MAILSQDGYIRLTFESFQQFEMVHLFSGMDEDRPIASGVGANSSTITGYTEWLSHTVPAITIGWDWEVTGVQGKARLIQTSTPGRNLMFVDQHGQDLGPAQTTAMLVDWLNIFHWQAETLRAISI
jgi:hypothetical protein